jgi:hypothetical protein
VIIRSYGRRCYVVQTFVALRRSPERSAGFQCECNFLFEKGQKSRRGSFARDAFGNIGDHKAASQFILLELQAPIYLGVRRILIGEYSETRLDISSQPAIIA